MVVVDYSINGLYQRDDYELSDEQRRQHLQLLKDDAAIDMAVSNFCPRLRRALGFLSRHKVGELVYCHYFCQKFLIFLSVYILP
jgi:hypothetical protein